MRCPSRAAGSSLFGSSEFVGLFGFLLSLGLADTGALCESGFEYGVLGLLGLICVHLAAHHLGYLGHVLECECSGYGHRVPVESAPALYHEQEVECAAVFLVVSLEVVAGVFDEASNLAAQEHFGVDITVVEGVFGVCCVSHGQADGASGGAALYAHLDGRVWFEGLGHDTVAQVGSFECHGLVRNLAQFLEVLEDSLAGDCHSEFLACNASGSHEMDVHFAVVLADVHHASVGLHVGQFLLAGAFLPGELGGIFSVGCGCELHAAASALFGLGLGHLVACCVEDGECAFEMHPFVVIGLEGYPVGGACHEVSALGIEVEHGLGDAVVGLEVASQWTQRHVVLVFAWCLRFVIDGEDSAVEFLVVAIVFACHLLVEEPSLGIACVWVFILAPVELPACVGPQFVVASVECVGEAE